MIDTHQYSDGEIPWCKGAKTDPWDHVEAAMGLAISGRLDQARKAFEWLQQNQLPDGSWYAAYQKGVPIDKTREANMTAYIAVGVFHFYLITQDIHFLHTTWPTLVKAIDFALSLQAPGGEIHWAVSPEGKTDPMALLTGSSSIYMSLKCALAISRILDYHKPRWEKARKRLGNAIKHKPQAFNISKARYSMDWFYPILCGAVQGNAAQRRLKRYWKKFIIEGQGVRCVSDRPWVTIAETCEFTLALKAMGEDELAHIIFGWISDKNDADGQYWCGFTYPDMTIWPEEKLTWTNAVVLMAADALFDITPASRLFHHHHWDGGCWVPKEKEI